MNYSVFFETSLAIIAILNDFLCISVLIIFGEIKCMFLSEELKQKFDKLLRHLNCMSKKIKVLWGVGVGRLARPEYTI
ncbi:hypothetical protein [Microcoleus sp. K1-B6]|uniref:hypothetical protein n=1 Tax=Microcoleus sp. K1-B6 TaxID=2818787 RepID=UPI002FD82278